MSVGGIEQDQLGGCRIADSVGRGDPEALHYSPDGAPGNTAPTPGTDDPSPVQKIILMAM